MPQHEKIDYIELPSAQLEATKAFFEQCFDWQFEDFGADYTAFANQGLDGGFYRANAKSLSSTGAALIVFYSDNLEATQSKIEASGGAIIKPTFSFPGGRRFHFTEPSGNEFAVWSDT